MEARFSARFVAVPRGATALTFPDYSRDVVSEIERLLERARTETTALAEAQAAQALDQAERLLRAHPELPQAAWLMAERHQLAALLAERTQAGTAGALRQRAAVLERERAPAFGQDPDSVALSHSGEFELELRGLGARDTVEWDGAELAFPARVAAGEHHLRVIRDGALAWAGWVSVAPAVPVLRIEAPLPVACSLAELGGTQRGGERPLPPAAVDCPAWAALRFERGRFELSLCRRSECGPWRAESEPPAPAHGPRAVSAPGFPLWASIALAGAGAALLTSVTLWQTGAFDRDERKNTRWVYEGYVPPASEP
jgi:hypothetical protein